MMTMFKFHLSIRCRFCRPAAAFLLFLCIGHSWAQDEAATASEHFVAVSNEEVVGDLVARTTGATVDVSYRIDNNGRGPKIKERLRLDERGYPLEWTVRGESLFGAEVDESYRWADGAARWRSQADEGSVAAPEPPMYIGGDDSPWSLGMYARALLADANHSLDVLPSGRMSLEALDTLELGDAKVRIFHLSGIELEPQLLALDASGALFASFSGGSGLIRKGFEAELPQLQTYARKAELDRLQDMQSELAHEYVRDIRYRNVRIFDPHSGTTGAPVSLRVSKGLIAAIDLDPEAGDPSSEAIVDGEGGTLVPGLHDMHAHNSFKTGYFYLAAGVTSTRDMGNDTELLGEIQAAIEAGEVAGTRITPAGLIEGRSPYSARNGIVAETLDEALDAVRWYADNDYYEIKLYNSVNPEWVVPMVAEAKRLGLGASGHVPAFMSPDEAILAGYDAIAHVNQLMLGWLLEPGEDTRTPLRLIAMKRAAGLDLDSPKVNKTIGLMREHDTALGTTAVILERLMLSRAGEVNRGDAPYLSHMPIGYQRYRKRTFVPLNEPTDDQAYQDAFQVLLDVIGKLHEEGVGLLIGTDDGTGFSVHRELELYVEAGVPAGDALAIATLGAATYLGKEDETGSLVPGKRADFFLVPGDPKNDISQIRRTRLVSRGGVVYLPEEIYRALGIEPFADGVEIPTPSTAAAPPTTGWFAPTYVDDAPVAAPVRTAHEGVFNGTPIRYDAIAGEFLLSEENGKPAATMFSTTYVRTDTDEATRPVMFVFNGGPGASSSPLHLGIGPVMRPEDDPQGALAPNPASPLDVVDLVFIDPVGTGFTRLFHDDAGAPYWGTEADADTMLALIRDWLERHGREGSPVYVMGESYGGTRAIVVGARAQQVKIDGLLLISPAIDNSASTPVVGNNQPFMALLPSMAATAVYHGVVEADGRTYTDVFDEAATFALLDYAAALYQGNTIELAERTRVAARLSVLTGLDEDYILEHNLRIDEADFQDLLLAEDGVRVGELDSRASGPVEDYRDRRPPGDDPSMVGGGSGGRSTGDLLEEYFRGRLGVKIDRPYRTLNLDLNQKWDHGQKSQFKTYFTTAPELQATMQANLALKVFIGGGVFDMATPIMAARYSANQIDVDPTRFVFRGYEAGHTVTDDPDSREAMSQDVRDFVGESARE